MFTGWVVFVTAAVATALLAVPVYRFLVARGIVDRPTERSSHNRSTARGGGLAMGAVVVGGGLWLGVWQGWMPLGGVLPATLGLAAISFWDDLRSLGVAVRFGCHVLAAVLALACLGWPGWMLGLSPELAFRLPTWAGVVLGLVWLAGYTNAFNFMDGINGLAGFQALITAAGTGLLGGLATGEWDAAPVLFAWMVAGAAAGFLPHNFPRARMFMGDVGSAPLGFLLAVLVLWTAHRLGSWLLLPLLLLHTNFVLDTGITLARRVARGEEWFRPHREHFYQRLLRSGKSHAQVTLWEVGLQSGVLALLIGYLYAGALVRGVILLAVIGTWGLFFRACERAFRTSQPASLLAASGAVRG
jgi:UDP-N-acetylmuramyl pentapeptide phosphotransferase/UDP-N-acetylglucosamine-1-phosphate transferase